MTDRNDHSSQNGEREEATVWSLPRRRLLAAMTAAGNGALAGCLSVGPSVEAAGLANSLVFDSIALAETFSIGGNRVTASVYMKPPAFNRFRVKELRVLAERTRPFSTGGADRPPASVKTGMNIPVQLPAGEPATISAVNEHGTTVESIRVTNDASAFLTGLGTKPRLPRQRFTQTDMPANILTSSFERRRTQFATTAEMRGRIENTSADAELTHLAAEAAFTNDAGDVVDRSVETIGLSPGEVWDVVVPYLGNASDATDGRLLISESHVGRTPIPPTNVTVLEDGLELPAGELQPPRVVGELRNIGTAELPFLEVSAKFYAEDGDVLGENVATVTGLNPGQTWSFEIPFYAHSTERAERTSEYELSVVA